MIERHVYIRLDDRHAGERDALAARAREVLRALPGVLSAETGVGADEHARAAWDLCLIVRLASLDHIQRYLDHPDHRALVDDYLAPRTRVKKAWNFVITE